MYIQSIYSNFSERIQVILKTTPFTYRAILQVKNVNMNDAMIYNCIGETKDGNKENLEYNLVVYSNYH